MAAEYDIQEDRRLENHSLFHTMIQYNATHKTIFNESSRDSCSPGIYYIQTAFAVHVHKQDDF